MELTREYILRLQKNRQGATGGGSGTAGTSGNYVTPAQLESALANKVDVSFFSRLFELYNGDGTTAAKIETNATLPEDTSKLNIKAPFDFWSQRSVSALGKGGSGSSSVFDEAAMWTALGGSIDNKQIALSHLTTALNGYVKGVKVGETTYSPNTSGIVDLGTITGRTYAFATGATNGTFKVTPSVGDAYEVAIKGLAALAYKASLAAEDIPSLDATKITTGILGVDRIPGLAASKIVSGTLDAARIPGLSWNKITTDKPTTLAGYGITDAKIENGVITLGANTITPVTQVTMTVPTGFVVTGSPLTKSGTLALSYAGGYEGFTTALKNKIEALFSWFELDSDGNVKTKDKTDGTHRGFWTESFVSALGKNDSGGSASVLNEPLQSINTTFSANPSASQTGYAIVWNGSRWTYGKVASDGVDMNTVWNALNGSTGGKQINTAWLTGVTKTLTITSGNTTVVYDGTVARSITINDMAAKQLTASTIDGTAGSFFFYGDNLINNQFDWVGIQVDKTSNSSPDRGQLVWDSGSISVRQNDGDSWTDWALVLTNKNYASQIAAGTITNAMLAGSIANSKLANSSVTVNGSSVSLGGSITTSKWGESRNINIASSDGTGASTSVSVDGSAAKTLLLPSTIKASLTGNATSATKLNTGTATYSAWGQTYWNNGVPNGISGDMTSVGNITMSGHVKMDNYKHIEIKNTSGTYLNVLTFTSANQFVLGEGLQSYPTYLRGNTLTLQTGTSNAAALTINASGLVEIVQNTQGLKIGNAYLVWDSANSALKVTGANNAAINFYATGGVSALGIGDGSGGGGVTLNEPLSSINSSSLGSPSGHTNSTLVYNGSSWVWSNSQGVSLGAYNFSAFAGNFNTLAINNKAVATQEWVINNYLPLSGGTMTGDIISKANGLAVRMDRDSANAKTGLAWYNANGDTLLGGIQFFNTSERLMLNATGVSDMWNDKVGNYTFIVGNNELKYNTYDVLHSGNYSTYIDKYVAKAGDTMTGGLTINYNNGTALSVNGAYSLSGVGTLSGLNLTASASQGITFKSSSTGRVLLGMDWYTNSAGTLTVSNSADNSGIFSYGGFKKSGSSDSYVLLGGGGHKALSEIGGGLTTSYVTSSKENLSSYWVKAWDITITDRRYNNLNMVILVQSEFNGLRGIICLNIQQVGYDNSGSYNFSINLTQMAGNIPNDRFRLYYNNSTGKCELWCNVSSQWGVFNFTVLKKTWRVGHDESSLGTFYSIDFSEAQTLPTESSATWAYVTMVSGVTSNNQSYKDSVVNASLSTNNIVSSQSAKIMSVDRICDSGGRILSGVDTVAYRNGNIATRWYVSNYNTDGDEVATNIIQMSMSKSGAVTYVVNNADKFREAIGVNLDNYLPKSGGTLTGALTINSTLKTTGSITIDNESQTIYRIPRKGTTTSGWAWQPISFVGNDNSEFFKIGMFGGQNTFSYAYIGTKAFDGANLRLGSDNSVSPGGHVYLRGAVADSSTGNTTQIVFGTSSDNHVALTSNRGAFIINPSTSGYTNQIVLSVTGNSYFSGSHNVGIGTTSPAQKLDVNGNARINGYLYILNSSVSSASAAIRVAQVSGHTWLDVAGADGDYGIYNNGDFHCAGYATFEGGYGSSDIRKKDIVKYVERSVEDIARAPIFDFTWKQKPNKGTHLGTSAQYWQGILPNSVVTSPDGYLAMDYGAVALASAVSVARKVVDHELRIKQLQDRVIELENEIKQLKAA